MIRETISNGSGMSRKFNLILVVLAISFNLNAVDLIVPGIYVDDGERFQLHQELDQDEIEELGEKLSTLLHLSRNKIELTEEEINSR